MIQANIPTVGEDDRAFRLDVPTMTVRIADYPDELKQPVLWLAGYVREKCNRNIDLLVAEANSLKIEFDKTTWTKVLRGRFQKSADGSLLPSPIVKLEKLLRAIRLLREQDDRRELAGRVPFIITPTAQTIFDFIDKKRAPDRVNKFGMIVGHTGTQKTATLREYNRNNNHGAGAMVESPANGSLSAFITDVAEKYGCSRQANNERKVNTIYSSVGAANYLIVENVQRLYQERDHANQRVFNFLQKLQDDTGMTIIITLTPVFVSKLKRSVAEGYFEQFIGRAGGERDILTLEEYPSDEDVLTIVESFKLADARKHLAELVKIVREPGRVRVLFEALQEAKVQAGKRELTINHVRAARGRIDMSTKPRNSPVLMNVFARIAAERIRQKELLRAGKILFDCASPIVDADRKLRVATEELGEVAQAIDRLERNPKSARQFRHLQEELVQLAAVTTAWLEGLETSATIKEGKI